MTARATGTPPRGGDKNPQPLRIVRTQVLRGVIPAMPQSSAVLRIEVRGDRIKRWDAFHDLPGVRQCLAPLSRDRQGVRFAASVDHDRSSGPMRHAVEQLGHLLVSVQESAGLSIAAPPLVTAMGTLLPRRQERMARLICPSPNPALLLRVVPEIVRIMNVWLTGKSFETLPVALEKVIGHVAAFAPSGQNMRLLLDAAQRLDVPLQPVAGRATQFGWGSRARWMDSSMTDDTPAIATRIARDKRATNRFLGAHGVPVPRQIDAPTLEAARAAAETLGFPVVVKPANLDGGVGVTAGIEDQEGLERAHALARRSSPQIVVESHVTGEDIRLGVINGEVAWATSREPAGVKGDGVSTLRQLIDLANQDARRGLRGWSLMTPLSINEEAEGLLKAQAMTLDDVPALDRIVRLRSAANISSGGVPRNVRDLVHPDNLQLAIRAARLLRLDMAGIDLITPDISRSWRDVGGAICEVNAQPQLTVEALDLPFRVVADLFKGDGRVPVIVMLGEEEHLCPEKLTEAFRAKGLRLGLALPSRLSVDGELVHLDTNEAFAAVRTLLADPDVACVVALVDDESWLASGLPVDKIDLLFTAETASAPMKGLLAPLQVIGTRSLEGAQLTGRAGTEALAVEAADLLAWHDGRRLPVERVASAALSASPYVRKVPSGPGSIGLCMIAKNEAPIICESLDSVRGVVDFVLVEDTGSTDGTQDIVRRWLADNDVAGKVIDVPWRDFAWNRTHALASLRGHHEIDYALILDADDVLVREDGFDVEAFKAGLTADIYDLDVHYGALRFPRPQLLRNAKAFGYRGVLHEFVETPRGSVGRKAAKGLYVQAYSRGARSHNRQKYEEDIAVLQQAIEAEREPGLRSRYLFYLAQSRHDARQYAEALEAYLERASFDFWPDEMYVAAYRAAGLKERLRHPAAQVEAAYHNAIDIAPDRMEAYHGLSRFFRLSKRHAEGYEIGEQGLARGNGTRAGLFIDARIYQFGLLEETALNAGLAGHHKKCAEWCAAILAGEGVPEHVLKRVRALSERAREGRVIDRAATGVAQLRPVKRVAVPNMARAQ